MSLTDNHSLEDNFRRDSFEDRICDDLCQFILQFLPIKDKIRQECVSKQFQRTVILAQNDLLIKLNTRRIADNLEKILKKFAIREIRFDNFSNRDSIDRKAYNRVIYYITKHCKQTTRFSIGGINYMYNNDSETFLRRFGHNLISAQINYVFPNTITTCGEVCAVEKLAVHSLNPYINEIEFNRLKSFKVAYLISKQIDVFEEFTERNRRSIKYLTLKCLKITAEEYERLLTIVSRFSNLVHLSINSCFPMNSNTFIKHRKQLATNCLKLKSIDFRFLIDPKICSPNTDFLSTLRHFQGLKRLRLELFNDLLSAEELKSSLKYLSFVASDGFQELTHLSIDLRRLTNPLEETILTAIDVNLPNLQFLSLRLSFNASQWTADILSRLSRLESLELFVANEEMRPQIESKLKQKCKKLRKWRLKQF